MRRVSSVDLMLAATILLWALNFTVTKYVLTHGFRPLAYVSIQFAAAGLLLAALTVVLEGTLRMGGRRSVALLALAVAVQFGSQFAFVYAIKLTNASTVALIMGAAPVFVALFSFAVGLGRLPGQFWVAAALTFAGVALVALGSGGGVSVNLEGDLLALANCAAFAVYSMAIAPLLRRYSPYRIGAVVLLGAGVPLLLAGSPQIGAQDYGSLGWLSWLALAFGIVGPLTLANVLWFRAIHHVGAARATLLLNVQPFVAALLALLILSERMHVLQLVGGATILAGIVLERARTPSLGNLSTTPLP